MFVNRIEKITLNKSNSLAFINRRLRFTDNKPLINIFLKQLIFDNGIFYSYLPTYVINNKMNYINRFEDGVLGWQKEIIDKDQNILTSSDILNNVANDIYNTIKETNGILSIGDPNEIINNQDFNIKQLTIKKIKHYLLDKKTSKTFLKKTLRLISYYPGAIGLIITSAVDNPIRLIEIGDYNNLNVKKIFFEAFDNEGYIFWEQSN